MQTLIKFEVLPGSKLLGPWWEQDAFEKGVPMMGEILVVGGGDRSRNQALVNALSDQGYQAQYRQTPLDSLAGISVLVLCSDVSLNTLEILLKTAIETPEWRSPQWTLLDFRHRQDQLAQLWGAVDDVVMGGISQSQLKLIPAGGLFSGRVSTDNNGGFASVRTKTLARPWDLSSYEGFRLRVRGDGQRYKFIARCAQQWDGIGYSYAFDTQAERWITVDIPFRAFIPVFRARSMPEQSPFPADQVYALQLMLSKFEYDGQLNPSFHSGSFSLEIEAIAVYGGQPWPQIIALSRTTHCQELLQEAGIPYCLLYNSGSQQANEAAAVLGTIGNRQAVNLMKPY